MAVVYWVVTACVALGHRTPGTEKLNPGTWKSLSGQTIPKGKVNV